MSALARYFNEQGVSIYGYDRSKTDLTKSLEKEGMDIHYEIDTTKIPDQVELVVYTPAIPSENEELVFCREKGWLVKKRAEVLGEISRDKYTIAVAGTHGKTTITSMIAHLLRGSEHDATAFIGGIPLNYGTNFLNGNSDTVVVEADEYDRSFHQLSPDIAIITAIDDDHLDIYGDRAALVQAYIEFTEKIKPGGTLLVHEDLKKYFDSANCRVLTYSSQRVADYQIKTIDQVNGSYRYTIDSKGGSEEFVLNIGGTYNVLNSIPAIAVAQQLGLDPKDISTSVESFGGIQRRFEYIFRGEDQVFIDDYAHHPEELRVLLESTRALFPEKTLTVVFQPHLFSRTRDSRDGFAESLSLADEIILLPIYPAREEPIEGVSSEIILERMSGKKVVVLDREELLEEIEKRQPELLLTVGAGDISELIPEIKTRLHKPH